MTTTAQRQCTVHQPRLGRLDRLNGLKEIWTRLGIYFVACPKKEEGRAGADAQTDANKTDRQDRQAQTQQTDANTTDRRNQNSQTQTKVRQDDNIRLRRTSKDTDKTTTELQRSQFAVVEDESTKHLIVDNPTHPHPLLGSSVPLSAGYLLAMHGMGRKPGRLPTAWRTTTRR